jgi:nucleoside-diphosphate-sugar epimerase
MISLYKKKLVVKYFPIKKGDIRHSQADISLAKNKIMFFPKCELKKGIKDLQNNLC